VTGAINDKKLRLLRHGLELDGRTLKPAQVTLIGEQALRFILKEGRNRQIRRMCEAVDLNVTDLFRIRIGPLKLGELPEGRWRPLSAPERAAMIKAGG
jgi:23S rRNA pseudouridine2604 synthase